MDGAISACARLAADTTIPTPADRRPRYAGAVLAALALFHPLIAQSAATAVADPQTLARVNAIRALSTPGDDAAARARYAHLMDESWQYFTHHKETALPTLRAQLASELKERKPNSLMLLDVGYFLYLQHDDVELARRALYRVDSRAPMVQANTQELFFFAHALAADHDPQILAFIDRVFLGQDLSVQLGQRRGAFDNVLLCAYLYGVSGPDAEAALRAALVDPKRRNRVLEVLIWIGTPASDDAVRSLLGTTVDSETFSRATTFLMRMGGPRGRDILLALDANSMDEHTRSFYQGVREGIEGTSFASLTKSFTPFGAAENITPAQLEDRLTALYDNYGRLEKLNPATLVNAPMAREPLIARLLAIRTRMFYRISDDGLNDVEIANAILNTLRYRDQ
jgi:hypothetical protein